MYLLNRNKSAFAALEDYKHIRDLGAGSFGASFEGVDPKGQPVVVKTMMKPGTWPLEAEIWKEVYPDLFIEAGTREEGFGKQLNRPEYSRNYKHNTFIVMKLLRGHTADQMSVEVVAPIIEDVLKDLKRMHDLGITHNDIKPDNIFVSADQARLIDMGLASKKWTSAQETELESARKAMNEATKAYFKAVKEKASPDVLEKLTLESEQIGKKLRALEDRVPVRGDSRYSPPSDQPVDQRSDIYQTGATAYSMLTGAPPKNCGTQAYPPHVPKAVADVIDKALACYPEDRYRSAESMLNALTPAVRKSMLREQVRR